MHIYWLVLAGWLITTSAYAQPINRLTTVQAVKARISSTIDLTHGPGECGRFEITKRVAWELRAEGAGFLAKTGAQNKCNEHNTTAAPGYGVDILMYTDGTVVDIIGGGVEGPNTPMWMVLSPAPLSLWRPPFDPEDDSMPPAPPPPPTPPPAPPTPPTTDAQLDRIEAGVQEIRGEVQAIHRSLEAHRVATRNFGDKVLGFLKDPRTILTAAGVIAGWFAAPGK